MTPLQSRMHTEVCLVAGLPACLCGAYARVGMEYAKEMRLAIEHYIGTLATGSICLAGHPCTWPGGDHRHWNEIETQALFELQKAALSAGAGEK